MVAYLQITCLIL